VAGDDAELAALAHRDGSTGTRPVLAVGAGDVLRTLGLGDHQGPEPPARDDRLAFPFDLGLAHLDDGSTTPFAAHVVARRRLWAGPFVVVCNVGWIGRWYAGPRAHPNDGLLDVIRGALPFRQRVEARRRIVTGSHLPHPALTTHRVARWDQRFDRPVSVEADGEVVGTTRGLRVEVRPDSFVVVV
jgi:hypothetical protein